MTLSSCKDLLERLAAGHFDGNGLPVGCTVAEASAGLAALASSADATGQMGEAQVGVHWRVARSGVAGEALRLWHDGDLVLAIEIVKPRPAEGWEKLRGELGAPEAKLEHWKDVNRIDDGQWVYAGRGLAIFTSLAEERLDRVVVFAPTTVADYRARLALGLQPPRELE